MVDLAEMCKYVNILSKYEFVCEVWKAEADYCSDLALPSELLKVWRKS